MAAVGGGWRLPGGGVCVDFVAVFMWLQDLFDRRRGSHVPINTKAYVYREPTMIEELDL